MKKKFYIALFIIILGATYGGYSYYAHHKTYNLSIVAIMKNEKPYLKEWIEYHLLQGVEHFYLCDNDSTDGSEQYLEPYIKKGTITYIKKTGKNQQLSCYEDVVKEYKDQTKWLAIIDLDEFLVPLKADDMQEFLKEFDDVSEVSLYWMNYGDNEAISRKDSLVTEFFTSHGKFLNHTVKSIVRPEKVVDFKAFGSNHYVKVEGKSVNENHQPINFMLGFNISADKARVNHYILKTFGEFLYKKSRGHPEGTAIDYSYYFFHNDNSIKNDKSMLRFLPKLKKRMQKSPLKDVPLPQLSVPNSFDELYFSKEEASQILNKEIKENMSFKAIGKKYKEAHPQYK